MPGKEHHDSHSEEDHRYPSEHRVVEEGRGLAAVVQNLEKRLSVNLQCGTSAVGQRQDGISSGKLQKRVDSVLIASGVIDEGVLYLESGYNLLVAAAGYVFYKIPFGTEIEVGDLFGHLGKRRYDLPPSVCKSLKDKT